MDPKSIKKSTTKIILRVIKVLSINLTKDQNLRLIILTRIPPEFHLGIPPFCQLVQIKRRDFLIYECFRTISFQIKNIEKFLGLIT